METDYSDELMILLKHLKVDMDGVYLTDLTFRDFANIGDGISEVIKQLKEAHEELYNECKKLIVMNQDLVAQCTFLEHELGRKQYENKAR